MVPRQKYTEISPQPARFPNLIELVHIAEVCFFTVEWVISSTCVAGFGGIKCVWINYSTLEVL